MLDDQKDSVESVKTTAKDILMQARPDEKQKVSNQLDNLVTRWDAINRAATMHQAAIEAAMTASKTYHDKLTPFVEWIDSTEKKVSTLEPIAADADTILSQIVDQRRSNAEITDRKLELDEVVLAGGELKKHASDDDTLKLDRDLGDIKDRFGALSTRCHERLSKMEEAMPLAQKFQEQHEKLLTWLQRLEPELQSKELTGMEAEKQLHVSNRNFYKFYAFVVNL